MTFQTFSYIVALNIPMQAVNNRDRPIHKYATDLSLYACWFLYKPHAMTNIYTSTSTSSRIYGKIITLCISVLHKSNASQDQWTSNRYINGSSRKAEWHNVAYFLEYTIRWCYRFRIVAAVWFKLAFDINICTICWGCTHHRYCCMDGCCSDVARHFFLC